LVQVTAVPARTAKLPAAPTEGAAATSEPANEGVDARRDATKAIR
jgi:hypothetical protein